MTTRGDTVDVWFSDGPYQMSGVVVSVVEPNEVMRVRIDSVGPSLGAGFDFLLGEHHTMRRLRTMDDAAYDDFLWSPLGEVSFDTP